MKICVAGGGRRQKRVSRRRRVEKEGSMRDETHKRESERATDKTPARRRRGGCFERSEGSSTEGSSKDTNE